MGAQLWIEASSSFTLPGFADISGSGRWSAPKLRALFWPNGSICWQVNLYLVFMRRSGLAVSSVNTYASELSVFIRFLAASGTLVESVDDDVLMEYSDSLISQNKSGAHINRLIHRVISFLVWYQQLFPKIFLIGLPGSGCQVTISRRAVYVGAGQVRGQIKHMSMVPKSIPRTVRPISRESLEKLIVATTEVARSRYKKDRDRCMLVLLADAGLRREELTWLRCERIREAKDNGGRLRVRSSKRRGNPEREIPIPQETLNTLLEFLEVSRTLHIRRIKRRNPSFRDDGWAFCTHSGKKMVPATVTQIFSDLRLSAGLSERATAHMLRHRYITLQVLSRLKALRKSGIGLEAMTTILSKVSSLSGHGSLRSLWTYVDWAYDELEASKNGIDVSANEASEVVLKLLKSAKSRGDQVEVSALELVARALSKLSCPDPSLNVVTHSFRNGRY